MRELTAYEIEEVDGGGWPAALAAVGISGLMSGATVAWHGGSFMTGFANGALSGAFIVGGIAMFSRSPTAGISLIGVGASIWGSATFSTPRCISN